MVYNVFGLAFILELRGSNKQVSLTCTEVPGFLAKGTGLKHSFSRIQGRCRVDTRAIFEAVAIFGCALSQSRHTEFWGFSIAKLELYPQIRKNIESKSELKTNYLNFFVTAAPVDLG